MARVGLAFGLLRDGASTAANQISTKFGDYKETAGMTTSINQ
jgi:hypothetical protein